MGRHPQKKNYFKWALPVKLRPPPRLNGQGGPFSGRQKRHFSAYYRIKLKSILIIKMIISVMKIDDYGDENDQKQTNTMPFKSKYTPFRHNYLVKKRTKSTGQGSTPPPQTGNAHLNIFFFVDVVP